VEVIIVRKLHAELEDKKKKTADMKARVKADELSFRKRRKQEIEDRSEQRAVLMVVINALVTFFFRVPELFVVFSASSFLFGRDNILYIYFNLFYGQQDFAIDSYYLTYILTFSANFLIYFLFNMKFKQAFYEWRNVKKKN
jgi:hypothetical protein